MKSTGALALAFAVATASLTGPAGANPAERGAASEDSMSGMMHGSAAGMVRGMARERPLLSLALQHGAELGLSAEQEKALRQLGFTCAGTLRAVRNPG